MKNSVIAIQSFVITTIVYTLLVPVFFEIENNVHSPINKCDNVSKLINFARWIVNLYLFGI